MRKIILALAAASIIAAPAAAAPSGKSDRNGRGQVERTESKQVRGDRHRTVKTKQVVHVQQRQQRNWRKGERFDSRAAVNYRVIDNPRAHRLSEAPRGYRWVQSNNDAVLVAIASGLIGAVVGNAL